MTMRRLTATAALFAAGAVLGACATTPLYKAQTSSSSAGYSETQLDANQYRVTFTGKRSTSRNTVEDGLMLRAAEVTQAAGFSHFVVDDKQTDREGDRFGAYDPWDYGPRFSFGYGSGFGRYGFYDPFYYRFGLYGGRGFDDDSRFVASADIALLSPAEAKNEPRAVNAAEVIANLGADFATPR
jgi:hypothetical protein